MSDPPPHRKIPVSISSKKFDEITKYVLQSYPKACVLFIDEIDNPTLKMKFLQRKQLIEATRGSVQECNVFHGSLYQNMDSIANLGYDPKMSRRCAFGKGTYFANSCSMSVFYTDTDDCGISYMMMNTLVFGTKCFGLLNTPIDTTKYDVAVNWVENPSIFVCPYDDAALPRYLIAFHKNAS
jgi:hypothetical protein